MARFYAENVEFLSPMFRGDFMPDLEPEQAIDMATVMAANE